MLSETLARKSPNDNWLTRRAKVSETSKSLVGFHVAANDPLGRLKLRELGIAPVCSIFENSIVPMAWTDKVGETARDKLRLVS